MRNLKRHMLTVCLSGLASFSTFAGMSDEALTSRLTELESYRNNGLDLDALTREASYERLDLNLEKRAWIESQIIVQNIRAAVLRGYDAALEQTGSVDGAAKLVRANMDKDMNLIAPELRDDIRTIVEDVLKNPNPTNADLAVSDTLLNSMSQRSVERMQVLLQGAQNISEIKELSSDRKGQVEHNTTSALVSALADDQSESERWVSTANMSARSGVTRGSEEEFSAQVSAEFLGVQVAAGPVFKFKKYISSYVDMKGEGLYPIFDAQGKFDVVLRDSLGRPRKGRRFMMFTCELESNVESETAIKGGFKVMGIGGEGNVLQKFTSNVNFSSRRVLVPDSIDNREATVGVLAKICHNDFMKARATNGRTIKQNLDIMTKNLASALVYVNPALKCLRDSHCNNWFNKEVIWMHKVNTTPVCVQEKNNPSLMTCQLRGIQKAACSVYQEGKRVSSGMFEYTCKTGYRCVITHRGGWFQNWELWDPWRAECRKN
ncbi:MAG: hypothetical protein K2P81_14075 [Bacteriovoracaceae bacterium]|nr:hypothetical protein [Bacteriovoracaceae bacterium]